MRLAVVSPFVDRRHGTERALAELLERLARDYHCEIHLYAQRVEDLALGQPSAPSTQERGGIFWHRVPAIPGPHLLQFPFWLFSNALCRSWDHTIRGLHFELVLSPGINCLDADVVIVHALFHRLRELAVEEANSPAGSGPFRRLHRRAYYSLLTRLERHVYTSSDVSLATVSCRTAGLLNRYFQSVGVRVIPYGLDATQFSSAKRLILRVQARSRYNFLETDFVLLLIGNDWRNKGLSTILDGMAAKRDLPLRLLVVGQDAAAPFFFEAAKRLGLSEQCRWEMTLGNAIHFYAAADAYVSPTLEDASALPPQEAMACGLPVITSVNNGGSQIITEGVDGFILKDPKDASALAQLLERLYRDPDHCRTVGENAARTAQAYTWDRNARETWEFLKEASAKKGARKLP